MSIQKNLHGVQAQAHNFTELLTERFVYRVPIFQRPYVWGKEQVKQLFEDISEIDMGTDEDCHFIGAMFVTKKSDAAPTVAGAYWVIDGQQRMTTIYLTLIALYAKTAEAIKTLNEGTEEEVAQAKDTEEYKLLTTNNSALRRHIIIDNDDGTNDPKFWTTLKDSQQLMEVMEQCRIPNITYPNSTEEKKSNTLKDAYTILTGNIDEYAKENELTLPKCIDELVKKFLQYTKIVFITITDNEDAGQIFNSLNSTALPLSTIDLVRNEIFSRAKGDGNAIQKSISLHDLKWAPFEKRFADQAEFDDFLFPYALLHSKKARKKKLMPTLRQIWAAKDTKAEWTAEAIISHLEEYAGYYLALHSSSSLEINKLIAPGNKRYECLIWKARRLKLPSICYPYLMPLLKYASESESNLAEAEGCLDVVESFMVRRFMCGQEPTGLHAVFKGLWASAKTNLLKLRKELTGRKTVNSPDDDTFSKAVRGRSIYRGSMGLYIVMEYERSLSTEGDPIANNYEELNMVTLDHIIPQSQLSEKEKDIPEIRELMHSWVNIIPMSKRANSEKSARDWQEARALINAGTRYHSSRKVAENENWSTTEINLRVAELQKWALIRWPNPKG
jgi:uncharacterized protein with ParB-like and HNH nuclease domain